MEKSSLDKNCSIILNTFFNYLPSRFFIILNSLVIIPFLAYFLSSDEMGLFQLSIGVLNLVCTCSTDWIAKSALRFWVKYKALGKIDSFFSNILFITVIAYILILVAYFCFSDLILKKFMIDRATLLLTLFIVIPCGIRQFLYQMLRIFNRPFLYTFSIIFYQLSLLVLFLFFTNFYGNLFALLIAMATSVFVIDAYIIKQINLNNKINFKLDLGLLKESLKYSLPLVGTNVSIWAILNVNKFVFQYNHAFADTAKAGVCWFFTTNILAILFSTFLFSVFPIIIKQFEKKRLIKAFVTNTIQLYFAIFIPIVGIFCFFSNEITASLLSPKYMDAHILLPFFALSIFGHELMKLINIKYHLKNRTYVEMLLALAVGLVALGLNIFLIPKFHFLAAGGVMLFSVILLIVVNSLVSFKSIDYLAPKLIFKTAFLTVFISTLSFLFVNLIFMNGVLTNQYFVLAKILVFVVLYYLATWQFRARIL